MNEHPPLDPTVDESPSGDSFDAAFAAAFGPDSGPPPAGGSVLKAFSAGLPAVPRVLLREPESFGGSPIVRPFSEEMPDKQDSAGRLQLHGEIARGGMGAVLKGRDVDLGRDVAVKVLLETHQGKTELLQRFIEEAQISGQLQHPGIAPVYELGHFVDKRPYFTMKLVKGKTLATLLSARKSLEEERTRYVGIFTQICQTLAYAHARGVIHRDLKPSNVMVGAFGEVQVMDWGLAKVLKEGGIADELKAQQRAEVSVIRTQRSEGSATPEAGSHTQAGTVLGTPAYMAPEQARGEVDLVDERADVFGLGAILCEILTGQAPYVGKGEELQYKARKPKLDDAFARLDACGADAELIALTRHCLAAEKWERPHHAGEVAEQVTAYQQSVTERLRQAELAETEARARAEEESKTREQAEARFRAERRARRLTRSLAAAVLLALTLAGGGALWYQRQVVARQAELREAVAAALDKVTDLRQRAQWAEARAVLEQVRQRLGTSGPEDLRNEVTRAEKDLALVDRLDAARLKATVWTGRQFDDDAAIRDYESAFREAGIGEPTEAAEVVAERIRASAVREQLVAAVDDWASRIDEEGRAWLLAVARAADPDPWRDRFRDVALWRNRHALERLAREANVGDLSPQILTVLGLLLEQSGADPVPLLREALQSNPSDFWLNYNLGTALRLAKRQEESIGYYRAALALRPATYAAYNELGGVLKNKGRLDEAIAAFNKAIKLDTKNPTAHINLGNALQDKGQLDEAIGECKKAIELDPKDATPHSSLGNALKDKGMLDEAITEYKKAIELDSKVALPHNGLGVILCDVKHDYDGAIAAFRKAIELDPEGAAFYNNLGNALSKKGRLDEAIAEYKKAIGLEPRSVQFHEGLGHALMDKGRVDEAIAEYQKALELEPKDALRHNALGKILCDVKRDFDGAIACFRKAIELDPKFTHAHYNLGNALCKKDRWDEAIAEWRKAIELDPKLPSPHNNLGVALKDKGRLDEAIAEFRKAIGLDPKSAFPHNGLGLALKDKGQLDEAIAELTKAIELDPKLAIAHNNLGHALKDKGRLDQAIAEWRKTIELDPRDANTHHNLGNALLSKGRLDEAVAEWRKVVELDPKYANTHTMLAFWEPIAALQSKLPAFLEGKFQPRDNAERLRLAQLCILKKYNRGAAQLYADAFAADPKRADDLKTQNRYNAACYAALAAAGQGEDAAKLDDKQRTHWRKQALDWLRADLSAYGKLLDGGKAADRKRVRERLQHWQRDADLAGIREAKELAKLPPGERQACEKLWANVTALLKKIEQKK